MVLALTLNDSRVHGHGPTGLRAPAGVEATSCVRSQRSTFIDL